MSLPPLTLRTGLPDWQRPPLRAFYRDTQQQRVQQDLLHEAGSYALNPLLLARSAFSATQRDVQQLLLLARRCVATHDPQALWAREDLRALALAGRECAPLPPMARPEGIVVDGQLKLLKLNLDSGLGWYFEQEFAQQRAAQLNALVWAGRHRVPRLWPAITAYVAQLMSRRGMGSCRLAVLIDPELGMAERRHAQLFANRLNASLPGLTASVRVPEALQVSGQRLRDRAGSIDILWRFSCLRQAPARVAASIALLQRAVHSDCLIVSSPADLALENTRSLALLSELAEQDHGGLDASERALVRRLLPWTRRLDAAPARLADMEAPVPELARAQRERLVLKPVQAGSADQALFGARSTTEAWSSALDRALAAPADWVLQENLCARPLPFSFAAGREPASAELAYSLCPFIFGDAEAAPFIRIAHGAPQAGAGAGSLARNAVCGSLLVDDPVQSILPASFAERSLA